VGLRRVRGTTLEVRPRQERRDDFASLADLEEDARLLFEYASRLDKLLGNDWIIARLPGPFRLREGATAAALPNPS
jgi:hypothetical protein